MNIIIEGCDGAGKSTLAQRLAASLDYPWIQSEGPGKSREEMNSRVLRYNNMENVIFDRHPCVSQIIYNKFREGIQIDLANMLHFKKVCERSLIIYCADADFDAQTFKPHDTPEHIQLMRDNFTALVKEYERWALMNAHIIHKKRMPFETVFGMAQACQLSRME